MARHDDLRDHVGPDARFEEVAAVLADEELLVGDGRAGLAVEAVQGEALEEDREGGSHGVEAVAFAHAADDGGPQVGEALRHRELGVGKLALGKLGRLLLQSRSLGTGGFVLRRQLVKLLAPVVGVELAVLAARRWLTTCRCQSSVPGLRRLRGGTH